MRYDELVKIEADSDRQKTLQYIRHLENELFFAIELLQNTEDDSQRNFLNRRINSMQTEYSIIQLK